METRNKQLKQEKSKKTIQNIQKKKLKTEVAFRFIDLIEKRLFPYKIMCKVFRSYKFN